MGFKHPWGLKRHHFNHSGNKPHQCGDCGKVFTLKSNLHRHRKRIHSGKTVITCRVDKCGIRMPKADLDHHIKTSHPARPHQCDVCPLSFWYKSQLTNHKFIHDGQKPFQCDYCEKTCITADDLTL